MNEDRLVLLGVNHRSAPVGLREQLAILDDQLPAALRALAQIARESYILSTCNRTEVYVVSAARDTAVSLAQFLCNIHAVPITEMERRSYVYAGEPAVRHLFRVSTGLDSMVLGEAQILGQVKEAFEAAVAVGTVGPVLGRLLPLAIETGRRARTETKIARGALSPSSVAVDLARRSLGDLRSCSVLVIGAGDAAHATIRSLVTAGVGQILVANRSVERAERLARDVGGYAVPYTRVAEALEAADIVISSTGASEPVVTMPDVRDAMGRRPERSLLCIDIAVPRDIDPQVSEIPLVHLYNVDDLEAVCAANLMGREREVAAVEAVIGEAVAELQAWRTARRLEPTIDALYRQAESIRRAEVARTVRRRPELSQGEREAIDVLTSSIVRRILHRPVSALKARSAEPDAPDLARFVRELFALPDEPTALTDGM